MDVLEKDIFGLKGKQYINAFLGFLIINTVGFSVVEILIFLVSIFGRIADPERVRDLLRFLILLKPLVFLIVSYLIARKIYSSWNKHRYKVFGQGVIYGVAAGVLVGVAQSLIHFIFTLLSEQIVDAILDLISFIWRSWSFMIFIILLVDGIIGIYWLKDYLAAAKQKSSSSEEPKEDKKDENS